MDKRIIETFKCDTLFKRHVTVGKVRNHYRGFIKTENGSLIRTEYGKTREEVNKKIMSFLYSIYVVVVKVASVKL